MDSMEQPGLSPFQVYTVSQLTSRIRETLYRQFRDVLVEGEVSNLKLYPSGHLYFTLKDNAASLKAVMFNFRGRYPENFVKDGAAIICKGRVDVYDKRGEYRLLVDEFEVRGLGLLQMQFELLKEKLYKEGLFDTARKRPLPVLPRKVGVVTSPAGAAVRDMLKVILGKFDNMSVLIYPVRVQGEGAALEIVEAIAYLNRQREVDVIIVGRGGGSLEDLASFNDEAVARAIHASKIPIVSGVGHEIDFTIADFVADARALTPTAAADMVVPDKQELLALLAGFEEKLRNTMRKKLESSKLQLYQGFVELKEKKDLFAKHRIYVDELSASLLHAATDLLEDRRVRLAGLAQRLADLNPDNILRRGYSITTRKDTGEVLFDANQAEPSEAVRVRLFKGGLDCIVTDIVKS